MRQFRIAAAAVLLLAACDGERSTPTEPGSGTAELSNHRITAHAYSGYAAAAKAVIGPSTTILTDAGPLNPDGTGDESNTALFQQIGTPPTPPFLIAEVLFASVNASGNQSQSRAFVERLRLGLPGLEILAKTLEGKATANCTQQGVATTTPYSIIGLLEINNVRIPVLENQPQTLNVGPFTIAINERVQSNVPTDPFFSHKELVVNALHVSGPGVDIVVGHAKADIKCGI